MTKMLAFIDGSIYSESVCDHAIWAAAGAPAEIAVFNVLGRRTTDETPTNFSGNLDVEARTALLSELADLDEKRAKLAQQKGRIVLDQAQAHLQAGGLTKVETHLRHGDLVETVLEFQSDADLLVIGKRGEAADFAKLHLGSNLERVVRSISKPILVAARAFRPIKRFLIAFDGGSSAMKAVDHIARTPLFKDLECHLLMAGAESAVARKNLDDAGTILRAGGYQVIADLQPGNADKVIADYVENASIDLLVMGAYGHSRIRNLIIGSTTTQMIRSCMVPVMLFR